MEPEAIPEPVKSAAEGKLWLGVLLADLGHYVRAPLRRYVVSHEHVLFELEWNGPLRLFGLESIPPSLGNDFREAWQILVILLKGSNLSLM
mgnify:CR=1 FL=1